MSSKPPTLIADRIEDAIRLTLEQGGYTVDILMDGAMNTEAFTARVINHLRASHVG